MASKTKKSNGSETAVYPCTLCSKVFKRELCLKKHCESHLTGAKKPKREKKHECETCHKKFRSKQFLKVHMHSHTGEKPHECHICGNRYRFAHGLRGHLLSHTGEKPFTCNHCGKAFAQKTFLSIHIRTHTDERPFACKTCGKAFHQRSHLRYHLMSHSTSNTYKCPTCGKMLRYKQSLQLHLRIHNNERPFKCNVCEKTFHEKPKLTIHLRTHSGVKPYICDVCGRRFAQKGNCDKHRERYHARDSERKYPCCLCPKAFIWKKCLDMHLQWHKLQKKNARKKIKKQNILAGNKSNSATIAESEATSTTASGKNMVRNISQVIKEEEDAPTFKFSLRENMRKFLPFLLDDEVLQEIGWPKTPIDEMVSQILRYCDQIPVLVSKNEVSEDDAFLQNVTLLLGIVLEEKFTEVSGDVVQQKSPNEIVMELLKLSRLEH